MLRNNTTHSAPLHSDHAAAADGLQRAPRELRAAVRGQPRHPPPLPCHADQVDSAAHRRAAAARRRLPPRRALHQARRGVLRPLAAAFRPTHARSAHLSPVCRALVTLPLPCKRHPLPNRSSAALPPPAASSSPSTRLSCLCSSPQRKLHGAAASARELPRRHSPALAPPPALRWLVAAAMRTRAVLCAAAVA